MKAGKTPQETSSSNESGEWSRQTQSLITAGELSTGIVHEARNLLTGVLGMVQVVRRRQLDDEKHAEWLERIESETRRCVERLNDFLRVPRSEEFSFVVARVNDVVGRAVLLSKHTLEMNRVNLVLCLAEELPNIQASIEILRQVLVNIILNAMQAMPNGGTIWVTTSLDGGDVVMSIADDGPGVPEEIRERIFEPRFTTRPVGEGTGLGLAFCQNAVGAHGGNLTLKPSAASGAEFVIRLPAIHAESSELGEEVP